jgi:ubiquitin carboxyl-terminal hydrolase 48
VSSNAYLLVYRRRGEALPLVPLDTEQEAALAAARESLESEQQQAVTTYAEAKQRLVERQATRQTEVRTVMEAAACLENGDLGCFVPLAWLDGWANGGVEAAPDPVDNSQLLCPHSKLDPAKVPTARRISTQAWQALQESCRGGPELSPADACAICLAAQLDAISAHEDTQAQLDRYAAMADALAKGDGPAQGLSEDFYISATWLQGWTKRKDKKNMSDKSPTAEITCACGRLAPESGGKGKVRGRGQAVDVQLACRTAL